MAADSAAAAVLTISTSRAAGEATDEGGPALESLVRSLGLEVATGETISDDRRLIAAKLRDLADSGRAALILTTGGTGFSPSDQTPEATRDVIEREAPGIAEAMRAVSREHTPHWMLSRAVAGIRGASLIINFPGNPKAIAECGEAIAPALPHALKLLAGRDVPH
jgi:molybdenum cofactor synthesis domain-containing protein